jgi:23S rRNA (guanosine2251-2'-O)-methyltransferase
MIVYGLNPVREAIRAHPKKIRFVAITNEGRAKLKQVTREAEAAGIPVREITPHQLQRMVGRGVHNGVAAEVAEAAYADFDEIAETAEVVLILDGIQDPQNLGAIIRVADCFGIGGVVLPEHDSAGVTAAAAKASAGAVEWVPITQVTNLSRAIETLQKNGFWVYGATADGDPAASIDLRGKVAIVMGSEGEGIRRNVLEHCDRKISIPMRGHVDSLNVAAATAVLCYELDRQRRT